MKQIISELTTIDSGHSDIGLALSNASSVLLWVADVTKQCVFFNKAWLQYRGRSLEQEYGYGWADGIHEDDYERCLSIYVTAFDARQPFSMEYRLQRNDGSYGWIQDDGSPFYDGYGEFKGYIGSCFDITESKRLFEALEKKSQQLEEANQRYEESVKAANIGFWEWDLISNEVRFSREYKRQIGYADDEFVDAFESWESRVHPDDLPGTLKLIEKSIDECTKKHESEFRFQHKDGHYLWIFCHASVLQDENGKPVKMIGSHVDISDRKKMESELIQSQKLEALGLLAGGVAHDFNNQLASVMGFADLIVDSSALSQAKQYADKISRTAEHAKHLTKQLLSFARKQDITFTPVDIHAEIYAVIDLLRHSIDKRIKIETNLTAPRFVVLADKYLLQNALLNLGLNASDAIHESGYIEVSTNVIEVKECDPHASFSSLEPGEHISIKVSDSGSGMSADDIQKAMEPFYTTKPQGKGTGLGLSSVYGSVQSFGGLINIKSELNEGSTIEIILPLSELIARKASSSDELEASSDGRSLTILVVDDEASIREVCADFLITLEHTPLFASDGRHAIELYAQRWPDIDLVLLDMMMPEMNGRETLKALKAINPNVKVLMCSGFMSDDTVAGIKKEGALDVIGKPFRLRELAERISSL
ncbi:PAS domain-containing protein [Alteromonas sp. ASW11-36]|uniref:histidine kinase n=1 Tax=Alteromonas arenosi TaxID=3055817 RepID=A0ABT7SV56_9ALTE|nr:PAS domain-containing sensor histidine kinase [Alteromonas sp. ASW11-36]MDM7860045.1 PAS domain-containing protein [Alteromonas sp. ASW11-36]